ncbi:MAG: pseudouridine synthase [Lachnospiraceae bacterium]|nr:pseudouridine synthase [Lachnospiraceae bacterium]
MSEDTGIRINKYVASAGVCSRREADKLIEEGRVTINGRPALAGDKVNEGDSVKVGSKLVKMQEERTVLAYYKPVGVTCTEKDEHAEITVKEAVRYKERVTYAGRLDKESEGLLIMTNDGDLIQSMMKGENRHEKEYLVKISKPVTREFVEKMSGGIYLKDLDKTTRPCKVERVTKDSFSIVLTQGLNRQIRRMCETLDVKVLQLKRVRVLTVTLGGLKPGEYRKLSNTEVESLRSALKGKRK